jgi:hypothetical protein
MSVIVICGFCGRPAEGNYSIHRDGFGVGPEVDLCNGCGGSPRPTTKEIWARIAGRETTDEDPEGAKLRRRRQLA